jgi:hypothetical protein
MDILKMKNNRFSVDQRINGADLSTDNGSCAQLCIYYERQKKGLQ